MSTDWPDAAASAPLHLTLKDGWRLQSERKLTASDAEAASPGFRTDDWYSTSVPSTVAAALVDSGLYGDPYVGMNLRSLPGMDYPVHAPFYAYPMADQSPFSARWWYRLEFPAPPELAGRHALLRFEGINQRADIWVNGVRIADSTKIVGAFRVWELDVSAALLRDGMNVIAVKVAAPAVGDLTWNWVDWNPFPPDKDMGLTGDVSLSITGPIRLRTPLVTTHLVSPDVANLTVLAEAVNASDTPETVTLNGSIEGHRISKTVAIAPRATMKVLFTPEEYPELVIKSPRLWWPASMGSPELYTLILTAEAEGALSDQSDLVFGVREVSSELTAEGHRLFKVNGRNVLIRGAGFTPELMLRRDAAKLEDEIRYVRDMNLNAIRLEGKLGVDPLFDLCDRYGVLVMAGVCCCDRWEMFSYWNTEAHDVAVASIADQARHLRAHPSVLVWLNGSDAHPPPDIEKEYLAALQSQDWPNPIISSAAADDTPVSGPSGVKMPGPYSWVPPNYWYVDKLFGGAFGFNTETSKGAAVPPLDSLTRFIPPEHLWPIDEVWTFHGGNSTDLDLQGTVDALAARYGASPDVADFTRKAQLDAYEGERAMFEAYGRNKYVATGVIHWMLDNAWPGIVWHLYDYYLKPAGGYFGAKRACEPLHIQFSYDDRSVVVVSTLAEARPGLRAHAEVIDLGGVVRWSHDQKLDLAADVSAPLFIVPEPGAIHGAYFLRLELRDAASKVVSRNWYWLSTTPDLLTAETPDNPPGVQQLADFGALNQLAPEKLGVSAAQSSDGSDALLHVALDNPGSGVAFFVRLTVSRGAGGEEVLPVRWDDNYVTLAPGEHRDLAARYRAADLRGAAPALSLEGWNVAAASVPVN